MRRSRRRLAESVLKGPSRDCPAGSRSADHRLNAAPARLRGEACAFTDLGRARDPILVGHVGQARLGMSPGRAGSRDRGAVREKLHPSKPPHRRFGCASPFCMDHALHTGHVPRAGKGAGASPRKRLSGSDLILSASVETHRTASSALQFAAGKRPNSPPRRSLTARRRPSPWPS